MDSKGTGSEVILAAHTNKNWYTLKKDLDKVRETSTLPTYIDKQDKDVISDSTEGETN